MAPAYPIDLVCLWVDGDDRKIAAKRNAALRKNKMQLPTSAMRDNRYRENEEIKYLLRSVEKFAPWVRHIFVITDDQRPKWIKTDSKITIVDHKEIIPEEHLPTFNSSTIEMFLHKVPGLSEHFIFANDDMFIGRPVKPDFFFDKRGNPIVIVKERKFTPDRSSASRTSRHFSRKIKRMVGIVKDFTGITYNVSFKHAFEPMRKSYIADNFRDMGEPSPFIITPFRAFGNYQRIILSMFDNAKGRNTLVLNWRISERRIIYDPLRDSAARRAWHLALWAAASVFGFVKYDCYDKDFVLLGALKKYRPTMFAVNDTSSKSRFDKIKSYLDTMFPKKSRFEK
ncbi:MAG: stealth family protein [Alphaproteobacteria bacterium]|nr:stealth family protein [Alphaproteobacteria bacterium]